MSDPKIIVALDYANILDALTLVDKIDPQRARLKVGKELFTRCGPEIINALVSRDFDVFLDLKYHDIPNTVAKACSAAADLGVWMLNVHALGGGAMMEAAKKAIGDDENAPLLIAVTLLTSMDEMTYQQIGFAGTLSELVLKLATLAQRSGLDGVVCSAQEAGLLHEKLGAEFELVTPGIRPAGSETGDQHRIMTPKQALEAGSHYLVIGRPITAARDPMQALVEIEASLA